MFCSSCWAQNESTARFCYACGQAAANNAPAAAPALQGDPRMRGASRPTVSTTPKRYAREKSPVVAIVLSVILVGIGQFYNGDVKKGALMLGIALLSGAVTVGVGYFAVMLWS